MKKKYYKIRVCIDCGNEKKVDIRSMGIRCNSCSNRITSKGRYLIDITGDRYGKLVALERSHIENRKTFWKCLCDCGKKSIHYLGHLRSGTSKSCGCLSRKVKGLSKTKTYKSYNNMMRRCYNPNLPHYVRYGGLGITVCKRWRDSYLNFLKDMGERPDGMTLDRIDSKGNYNKKNCRWATPTEQGRNKKNNRFLTLNGKTATLAEWAPIVGIDQDTLSWRATRGWTDEEALTLKTCRLARAKKVKLK